MSIVGQSKYPLQVQVLGCRVPITITLGKVTVIHNLGCPVLIGQPAKISNEIVTLPHKHKLTLKDIHGIEHTISYPLPPPKEMFVYETLKSPNLQILYPGETLTFKLSNQFSNCKMISFTPRPDFLLTPAFIKVDGNLNISISSRDQTILQNLIFFYCHEILCMIYHIRAKTYGFFSVGCSQSCILGPKVG